MITKCRHPEGVWKEQKVIYDYGMDRKVQEAPRTTPSFVLRIYRCNDCPYEKAEDMSRIGGSNDN